MENKLSKKVLFANKFTPYDFSKNMGQLAVEVNYTDGSSDMLTTKSTKNDVAASHDFETEEEYYKFIDFLIQNGVQKN